MCRLLEGFKKVGYCRYARGPLSENGHEYRYIMTLQMGASITPLGKKTFNAWLERREKNMIVSKQVVEKRVSCTVVHGACPNGMGRGPRGEGNRLDS